MAAITQTAINKMLEAEAALRERTNRDESLTTVTVKIPRWAEDEFKRAADDSDLKPGEALRIGLVHLASFLRAHWKRGPALSVFLEHVSFIQPTQYDIFFERRGKPRN